MHEVLFYASVLWMSVLLVGGVLSVLRAGSTPSRILALDMLVLVLVALLALFSGAQRSSYFLDAALVLALLSFVSTLAACRYHGEGRLFS